MPKNWMFEIYEDTPEEEAANLMEHSTLTLDLSSDDEGVGKDGSDRGKENTPPEGYDAPAASRSASEPCPAAPKRVKKSELIRRKADVDEMDDGERSPLSSLETQHFIPEGLDKDSHVVIEEGLERSYEVKAFSTPVSFDEMTKAGAIQQQEKKIDVVKQEKKVSTVTAKAESKEEVVVWEDKEN